MKKLQSNTQDMPSPLTLEKPALNLAALTSNNSLDRLTTELIGQWERVDDFAALQKYGIRPLNRALFYGPPGNGKTMAAQLVASKLDCPLYRVRCESLLTSAFGGTEQLLTEVMDWIAEQPMSVVLWDECESIFPDRSTGESDSCTRALINTMQIFWQRLDRWSTPQMFLMATNLIGRLDSALSSRVELQLEFGPPTKQQALDVLTYWREVFHEYGSDVWGEVIRKEIESNALPSSFRDLWQSISGFVRDFVINSPSEETNE